jgi:hypothetical protein
MQHLKRRPKRCVEVKESWPKEAQGNSEEIQEEGSQPALWWRNGYVRCAPDCLCREVHNRELSGAVVHRTVWLTVGCSFATVNCYRPQGSIDVSRAPDMSGMHRTVRCARRQKHQLLCPTNIIEEEAINTLQLAIWRYGSPSNILTHVIDIFKCSNTQVLNRITRWLA